MIRAVLLGVLVLLIARAFWRLVDGIIEAAGGRPARRQGPTPVKLVRDPVCGTHVAPAGAPTLEAGGARHYFCSTECRDRFRKA